MMEFDVTVQVGGEDLLAGRLYTNVRRGVETSTFRYAESYLDDARAFALDPELPLMQGAAHSQDIPLFRAFEDCMPDRWGRNLVKREERRKAREDGRAERVISESDLLAGVSDETRQGALRIWRDGKALASAKAGVPREVSIPDLLNSADRAAKDMDADIRDLLEAGSSLGGARPKASVRDEKGELVIAKFPKVDEDAVDDVCAWEYVALNLAAKAKINVPKVRLLRVKGRSVLLLERFDRVGNIRVPYMSGLTAIQGQDGGRYSYLELIDFLEVNGSSPDADAHELWRRILFGCAIGNTDDHMRNHGFLRDGKGWRLSPAFDINPTPGDQRKYLSTAFDFGDCHADPEAVLAVCEYYRLGKKEARTIAREVRDALRGWRVEARKSGISAGSIANMQSCFESGIARLGRII